jgi:hypothetical protein
MWLGAQVNFRYLRDNRQNLRILHTRLDIENMPLLIFVNKGIEVGTHALTLEIIADTCGPDVAKAATFIVCHSAFFLFSLFYDIGSDLFSQVLRSRKKV